jgi:hypothetical protein
MSQILALDANMIVLLVVGLADENAVPIHKRTRAYTVKDFRLLLKIISNYELSFPMHFPRRHIS